MKVKKYLPTFFIVFLSLGVVLWTGQKKPQKKESEEKGIKSLIRKELLLRGEKKLKPPLRNIFSPPNPGGRETEVGPVTTQQSPQKVEGFLREGPSRLPLNVRYIGCIVSPEKVVALIIFRGDALVVEKGEMIGEGVKVGKITPLEIEIIDVSSGIRRYPLEGEKK